MDADLAEALSVWHDSGHITKGAIVLKRSRGLSHKDACDMIQAAAEKEATAPAGGLDAALEGAAQEVALFDNTTALFLASAKATRRPLDMGTQPIDPHRVALLALAIDQSMATLISMNLNPTTIMGQFYEKVIPRMVNDAKEFSPAQVPTCDIGAAIMSDIYQQRLTDDLISLI